MQCKGVENVGEERLKLGAAATMQRDPVQNLLREISDGNNLKCVRTWASFIRAATSAG
jgi:hypothetical protein